MVLGREAGGESWNGKNILRTGQAWWSGAQQRIAGEDKPIRYVNGRYKLRGQSERRLAL